MERGEVNTIFLYVLSVVIIVFVGFLVIKFISGFSSVSEEYLINDFYKDFENTYSKAITSYNSMTTAEFVLPKKVTKVCFFRDPLNCEDNILKSLENVNIAIMSNGVLMSTKKIGDFSVENSDCFCKNLSKSKKIKVSFENKDNNIFIYILK